MLKIPTITKQTSCLSTFTPFLLQGIRKIGGGGILANSRIIRIRTHSNTANILRTKMPKRKRAAVVKAESRGALSTARVENLDISDEPEHEEEGGFEPELAPAEEEDSEEFDPELDGNGNSKRKKVVVKKDSRKTKPKKNPAVSRKDKIKTEDKNGEPITRVPQVNSDYLPLPWKGRLGFVILPALY